MAARARPKLLVLTHILFMGQPAQEIVDEVKSHFSGPVVMGADLAMF